MVCIGINPTCGGGCGCDCLHFRLAELEIAKFQDQVIKRLRDDMASQLDVGVAQGGAGGRGTSPVTGAIILHHETPNEMEWTLPKAFLYSLTVLTTIGECHGMSPVCVCINGQPRRRWSWLVGRLVVCLLVCLFDCSCPGHLGRNERKSDSPTRAVKGRN